MVNEFVDFDMTIDYGIFHNYNILNQTRYYTVKYYHMYIILNADCKA